MTDTPEDIRAKAASLIDGMEWSGDSPHLHELEDAIAQALMEERNRTDKPATTVYGTLLWHHHQAARKDFNGPERKRIFDLIAAFQAQYPDECKVWDDRYPGTSETETPNG